MKITNLTLIGIINTLEKFGEKKLPQKISYAITRNLMCLSKEYQVYEKQLNKIFAEYTDHIVKDEHGNMKLNSNGIPIVDDSVSNEFGSQISDLLNIEIQTDLFIIPFESFNYDDKGIYDAMSAQDIMLLKSILCNDEN